MALPTHDFGGIRSRKPDQHFYALAVKQRRHVTLPYYPIIPHLRGSTALWEQEETFKKAQRLPHYRGMTTTSDATTIEVALFCFSFLSDGAP